MGKVFQEGTTFLSGWGVDWQRAVCGGGHPAPHCVPTEAWSSSSAHFITLQWKQLYPNGHPLPGTPCSPFATLHSSLRIGLQGEKCPMTVCHNVKLWVFDGKLVAAPGYKTPNCEIWELIRSFKSSLVLRVEQCHYGNHKTVKSVGDGKSWDLKVWFLLRFHNE